MDPKSFASRSNLNNHRSREFQSVTGCHRATAPNSRQRPRFATQPRSWFQLFNQHIFWANVAHQPTSLNSVFLQLPRKFVARVQQVFVFLQMNRPMDAMELMAICDDLEGDIKTFDVKDLKIRGDGYVENGEANVAS